MSANSPEELSRNDEVFLRELETHRYITELAQQLRRATPEEKRSILVERWGIGTRMVERLKSGPPRSSSDKALLAFIIFTEDPVERAYLQRRLNETLPSMQFTTFSNEQRAILNRPTGLLEAIDDAYAAVIPEERRAELDHVYTYIRSAQQVRGDIQMYELGETITIDLKNPRKLPDYSIGELVEQARASWKRIMK